MKISTLITAAVSGLAVASTLGGDLAANRTVTGPAGSEWIFQDIDASADPARAGYVIIDASLNNGVNGDAFDGAAVLRVNGQPINSGPELAFFDDNPTTTTLFAGPVAQPGGITAGLRYDVYKQFPICRVVVIIENFNDFPVGVGVDFAANLGSDETTQIITSSDLDTVADRDDGLIVSDDFETTDGDPAVLHAFFGGMSPAATGATRDNVFSVFGPEGFASTLGVTVQPNDYAVVMFFYELNISSSQLASFAADYRDVGTVTAIGGLFEFSEADLARLANWGNPACEVDFNGDGIRDLNDIVAFIQFFNDPNCIAGPFNRSARGASKPSPRDASGLLPR